mmetsp:Transcript_12195/g.39167  ORF Transcript_12195/g.39167 Transcript_12195/m.39167 type:complete len:399 (+) Transcript_12195:121-1317(+)
MLRSATQAALGGEARRPHETGGRRGPMCSGGPNTALALLSGRRRKLALQFEPAHPPARDGPPPRASLARTRSRVEEVRLEEGSLVDHPSRVRSDRPQHGPWKHSKELLGSPALQRGPAIVHPPRSGRSEGRQLITRRGAGVGSEGHEAGAGTVHGRRLEAGRRPRRGATARIKSRRRACVRRAPCRGSLAPFEERIGRPSGDLDIHLHFGGAWPAGRKVAPKRLEDGRARGDGSRRAGLRRKALSRVGPTHRARDGGGALDASFGSSRPGRGRARCQSTRLEGGRRDPRTLPVSRQLFHRERRSLGCHLPRLRFIFRLTLNAELRQHCFGVSAHEARRHARSPRLRSHASRLGASKWFRARKVWRHAVPPPLRARAPQLRDLGRHHRRCARPTGPTVV